MGASAPGSDNEEDESSREWLEQQLQLAAGLHGLELVDGDSDDSDWEDPTGGLLSALLAAAADGEAEVLAQLLADWPAGLESDGAGPDGDTALHLAALYGHEACVAALLQHGSDPEVLNVEDGSSALHDAAAGGYVGIVKLLLQRSPSLVHVGDEDGDTPLHNAARGGHREVAELLLAAGADPNRRNEDDKTPAEEAGPELQELLQPAAAASTSAKAEAGTESTAEVAAPVAEAAVAGEAVAPSSMME